MLTSLLALGLVHWFILVTPGPNVLLVTHLGASGQRRAALMAGWGISTVAGLWAGLAMLGINALFAAMPGIRLAVQVLGGLYLCHLALKVWRSGAPVQMPISGEGEGAGLTPWQAYRLGLITNLLNPKSALMFSSLFVAALPAQPDGALQTALLVMVVFNAVVWHSLLALAFSHSRVQAVYARQRLSLARLAALCLGGFGLRLLVNSARDWKAA